MRLLARSRLAASGSGALPPPLGGVLGGGGAFFPVGAGAGVFPDLAVLSHSLSNSMSGSIIALLFNAPAAETAAPAIFGSRFSKWLLRVDPADSSWSDPRAEKTPCSKSGSFTLIPAVRHPASACEADFLSSA